MTAATVRCLPSKTTARRRTADLCGLRTHRRSCPCLHRHCSEAGHTGVYRKTLRKPSQVYRPPVPGIGVDCRPRLRHTWAGVRFEPQGVDLALRLVGWGLTGQSESIADLQMVTTQSSAFRWPGRRNTRGPDSMSRSSISRLVLYLMTANKGSRTYRNIERGGLLCIELALSQMLGCRKRKH